MKGVYITLGIIATIIGFSVTSYIGAYNYRADMYSRLETEWQNNKQIRGNYSMKIAEAAGVPSMQTDDLVRLFEASNKSRYGSGGSNAVMQWIQEQNPKSDQRTYLKIMQLVEGGRNKFENSQTKLLDIKRNWIRNRDSFWRGMWLRISSDPIDIDKYNVITSADAERAFEEGIDTPVKLR